MKVEKAGVIIRREKERKIQVLLLYLAEDDYWQFPKGHIDLGESAEETALREAEEETGYKVKLLKQLPGEVNYRDGNNNLANIVYFLAEIQKGKMQAEDGYSLKWVSLEKAYEILTYKELKDYIKFVAEDVKTA